MPDVKEPSRIDGRGVPPELLAAIKQQATVQVLRTMLEQHDAGAMTADEFVAFVRRWIGVEAT